MLIPALARHHPEHALCRPQIARLSAVPAHVLLETYSWLTGYRAGVSFSPASAHALLDALELEIVQLPAGDYLGLVGRFAFGQRAGAAIYDAQIAATAKHHGLKLLSRDRRAAATYELIGVDYELV
ncbi:MAG: PIN domain-containing protein [Leucobacter sp.]